MRVEAGRFKGRRLPRVHDARPALARLKRSLFSVLEPELEGARVLDLFAGAGSLGLEALSRGARHVTLVDRDDRALAELARWLERVGASDDEARLVRRDLLEQPPPAGPWDLVFSDPPFAFWDGEAGRRVLAAAVDAARPHGRVVTRLPAKVPLPQDPRWREVRCRKVGSSRWFLVAPHEAG